MQKFKNYLFILFMFCSLNPVMAGNFTGILSMQEVAEDYSLSGKDIIPNSESNYEPKTLLPKKLILRFHFFTTEEQKYQIKSNNHWEEFDGKIFLEIIGLMTLKSYDEYSNIVQYHININDEMAFSNEPFSLDPKYKIKGQVKIDPKHLHLIAKLNPKNGKLSSLDHENFISIKSKYAYGVIMHYKSPLMVDIDSPDIKFIT